MADGEKKYKLRYFFDYGAGGCLWADNDLARQDFGFGPIDETVAKQTGKLSADTLKQINELDNLHAEYYNNNYPVDPSLWRQSKCDEFNQRVDQLLHSLKEQLSSDFEIEDKQIRYSEDQDLDAYLKDPKKFKRES